MGQPVIESFSLDNLVVKGGERIVCTVTVREPAESDGATINLAYTPPADAANNPLEAPLETRTIKPDTIGLLFALQTKPRGDTTHLEITAYCPQTPNERQRVTLTILPSGDV